MRIICNAVPRIQSNFKNNREYNIKNNGEFSPDEGQKFKYNLDMLKQLHPSFKGKCQANILFKHTKYLTCALTGKPMIDPVDIDLIYDKLSTKTNAASIAIYLQAFRDYMHDVEKKILELFANYKNYGDKNFQDVLKEYYPKAMLNLKEKELSILNGANGIIEKLEPEIANKVVEIRDFALSKVKEETLCRSDVLTQMNELCISNPENTRLREIYKEWYQLPTPYKDTDAFIVEYSNYPHDEIARRLISTSCATLKSIKPQSEGGERTLGNYLLVSKLAAKDCGNTPLGDYIEFNPETTENIKKYLERILTVKVDGKPLNIVGLKYPQSVRKNLSGYMQDSFLINAASESAPIKNFLMNKLKYLPCAFSGKSLLSPHRATSIYENLSKKPNAKSAVNLLENYKEYMQDVESQVFDMIKSSSDLEKKDFQQILQEKYEDSYYALIDKEVQILTETDDIISSLSQDTAVQVREIRNFALSKINDGIFNCKNLLKQLASINATGKDKAIIDKIYKHWYTLPRPAKDYDAFIVKYANYEHEKIAQRLLSSSVATIKTIGTDTENIVSIPVSRSFDDFEGSLKKYIELNPGLKIKENLKNYISIFITEVNKDTAGFRKLAWYPERFKAAISSDSEKEFAKEVVSSNIEKNFVNNATKRKFVKKQRSAVKINPKRQGVMKRN